METRERDTEAPGRSAEREPYEKPVILYEGEIETLAVVCDSAYAGFSNCRLASIPTCIRVMT